MTKTSSTTPTTKPSTSAAEPLVPGARHAVVPKGIVSTAGRGSRRPAATSAGASTPGRTRPGRLILAKAEGGRWAADLSILSIPRQVGKSYLLGCIIFALCLLNPKLRVIWTSHHTATTEEMYEAMKELARTSGSPRTSRSASHCRGRAGASVPQRLADRLRRPLPGLRSRQGEGRGPGARRVPAHHRAGAGEPGSDDEHQRQPADPVRRHTARVPRSAARRSAATQGRPRGLSDDTLYVEFSADQDADPDDRKQWAKANPSFPKRTQGAGVPAAAKKILDLDDFRREGWASGTTAPRTPSSCRPGRTAPCCAGLRDRGGPLPPSRGR
jgi:hypothetical protein